MKLKLTRKRLKKYTTAQDAGDQQSRLGQMLISLVYRSQLGNILAKPCYRINLGHHAKATNVYSVMEDPGTMNAAISQILHPGGED